MGTTSILEMAFAYGLRPWLWFLGTSGCSGQKSSPIIERKISAFFLMNENPLIKEMKRALISEQNTNKNVW